MSTIEHHGHSNQTKIHSTTVYKLNVLTFPQTLFQERQKYSNFSPERGLIFIIILILK